MLKSINHDRDGQFELLTIIAMLLVIAGHCEVTYEYRQTWIFNWIYSFHMPLFFFISGFLFALTNTRNRLLKTTYLQFFKKKFIRLMIPFIFFNLITIAIKLVLRNQAEHMLHPIEFTWHDLYYNTFVMPTGYLWFLLALFLLFIVIYPLYKTLIKYGNKFLLNITLFAIAVFSLIIIYNFIEIKSASFLQSQQALKHLPWFVFGILYCQNKHIIDTFFTNGWQLSLPLFAYLSCGLIFNEPWSCFVGIILFLILSLKIYKYCPLKFLRYSTMTYGVYLLSYFPLLFNRNFVYPHLSEYPQYIFNIGSFVLATIIPVGIITLYRKLQHKHPAFEKMAYLIGIG